MGTIQPIITKAGAPPVTATQCDGDPQLPGSRGYRLRLGAKARIPSNGVMTTAKAIKAARRMGVKVTRNGSHVEFRLPDWAGPANRERTRRNRVGDSFKTVVVCSSSNHTATGKVTGMLRYLAGHRDTF